MEKLITAVRYHIGHKHIDSVQINATSNIEPRERVVANIRNGDAYWTYPIVNGVRIRGSLVKIVLINGAEYLKTINNGKEDDNLGELPEF